MNRSHRDFLEANPYASPCNTATGEYDLSLAKRMWLAFSALAFVYLLCGAVNAWQQFRADCNHRHEPVINTVVEFCLDWRDSKGLE